MALHSYLDRNRMVGILAGAKENVSQAVSDRFFFEHPEWLERYGARGRQFCKEDTRFHLDFLAGAIEAGSPESFADYALWTARMLRARGIAGDSLQENLEQIGAQLSAVFSAEEFAEVSKFLERGANACVPAEGMADTAEPEDALRLPRELFLTAILAGQRQAALTIINEALREGHEHLDIYVDVFAAALHRVGKLWESNKITVAQEHMATAITQFAIASIYPRLIPSGPPRGRMVVTGVSGELHQIGANLVADSMEAQGWSVRFLGSNLPHKSILETVEETSADVLCISTTIVANLPSAADLIRSVRTRMNDRAPRIFLGGAAYRLASPFAEYVGAAGPAMDLRGALTLLCGV